MQVAQRLYEGVDIGGETVGLITYMRTDGVQIVPEAIDADPRRSSRASTRQALRRALRPRVQDQGQERAGSARGDPPDRRRAQARSDVARYLEKDQAALYELIWKRTIASQMASAEIEQTTVDIEVKGRDGKAYGAARDRLGRAVRRLPQALRGRPRRAPARRQGQGRHDRGRRQPALPAARRGRRADRRKIEAEQHFTEPPPRYSEATLVKKMEELGIGRPSTYASTLTVLRDRDYVRIDKKRLDPRGQGPPGHRLPGELLQALRRVRLHRRSRGEARPHLRRQARLEGRAARLLARLHRRRRRDQRPARRRGARRAERAARAAHLPRRARTAATRALCPTCGDRAPQPEDSGKFGAFIGCSNYPECRYTRQLADQPATTATPPRSTASCSATIPRPGSR